MERPNVRIGVVGAGYWGPNLIRNCAELGVLDSVCDIDDEALEATRLAYPSISTVGRFSELLARRIDAVVIAAPAQYHARMCLEALDAGKHVFVEKPLALTVAEGRRIAEIADSKGLIVFVGHLLLYHPAVKKLRSLIAEGVIGDVWHVRSRRLSLGRLRVHENVWWSFAPHDVALVLAIMDHEPTHVTAAQTARQTGNLADVAYADFTFPFGRSAHIEVCWLDPEKSARLDVFGSSGVVTLNDSRAGSVLTVRPLTVKSDQAGKLTVRRGEELNIHVDEVEPLKAEINAFVEAVVIRKPAETDAWQGVRVLQALAMAEDSARVGIAAEARALA